MCKMFFYSYKVNYFALVFVEVFSRKKTSNTTKWKFKRKVKTIGK